MKSKPSQGAQIALVVVALIAVAAAGFFFVISPKRASTADVASQIEVTQQQIDAMRAAVSNPAAPPPAPVDVSELFQLTKAMPDRPDMASIILELNRIAKDTGIDFESIEPVAATAGTGYQIVSVNLVFDGNFYSLTDFLFRVRNLVAVRDGKLSANGRLFNVKSVSFAAPEDAFPNVEAMVAVEAYVYGGEAPAAAPPPASPPPAEGSPPLGSSAAPAVGGSS